jgi:hypothetical protein
MPAPIDYNTFLANVNEADLAVMTNFIVGATVTTTTGEEADGLYNQCVRLYDAGMISEMHRIYKTDTSGDLQQSFSGVVTPVGAGYLVRLARERVILSRDPLPEA